MTILQTIIQLNTWYHLNDKMINAARFYKISQQRERNTTHWSFTVCSFDCVKFHQTGNDIKISWLFWELSKFLQSQFLRIQILDWNQWFSRTLYTYHVITLRPFIKMSFGHHIYRKNDNISRIFQKLLNSPWNSWFISPSAQFSKSFQNLFTIFSRSVSLPNDKN